MPRFQLERAQKNDVPVLADIAGLAFQDDRHTQLRAQNPVTPYDHRQAMFGALSGWVTRQGEGVDLMKATHLDTGHIVGWVCWGSKNVTTRSKSSKISSSAEASSTQQVQAEETKVEQQSAGNRDPLAALESLTSSLLSSWMEKITTQYKRNMYITAIAVHPSFHRQGLGKLLVRYGTEHTDRHGVIAWVAASDAAASLFAQCGFYEDERLEVDLDEWAARLRNETGRAVLPPSGDRWGIYTFRYMKRDPVALTKEIEP